MGTSANHDYSKDSKLLSRSRIINLLNNKQGDILSVPKCHAMWDLLVQPTLEPSTILIFAHFLYQTITPEQMKFYSFE